MVIFWLIFVIFFYFLSLLDFYRVYPTLEPP